MSSSDSVAQALAGAGGGALAMITTYPLITLSTRAQTERRKSVSADSSSAAATVDLPDSSKSAVDAARKRLAALKKKPSIVAAASKIIQREGVSGLYSGLQSALFGISVTNFVYYYFYEGTRSVFERRKALKSGAAAAAAISQSMSTLESMLAGAIAGSATVILTNPIWVVNTRETARVGSAPKQSTFATIRDILENDGPGAFFAGLMPALVLVINPILQYTIFERLRAVIERKRALRPLDFFILGALGKLVATSTTYPYITVKARMQVQRRRAAAAAEAASSSDAAAADAPPVYTSTVSALKQIASTEGWKSLYSGMDSKIVQSVLTSAFLFYFKEQLVVAAVAFLQLARRKRLAAN
ncbi:mitochondrial carrier domain-containing protein [Myxozyma melibiosi]|uniref:Mitochondrial carrier domain-containing protein n=1 Tax=Myxozyma melibiosi TaxID=54550 RepID=A0ABR1F1B5_9ASCO